MAKYVIEIPDSEETMWEGFNGDLFIPITMNKGTKTWINTDLKMTPYTEPDEQEIRQNVEQEVWEFAGEFYNADREVETLFGCDLDDICKKYTYSEAKSKYEKWQKQKYEIHEYDEIISEVPDNKAVIVRIDCWGQWHCVNSDGIFMVEINQQGYWRKTGRSFPELGDVLKKMEE